MKILRTFLALAAICPMTGWAHNLDTRATSVTFAQDFVNLMSQRAATNGALVQVGDEFWVVIKTTPGPGTATGVGGYQTFYVPGGVQVIDAAYVQPSTSDPRGFVAIPIKGQSPIAVGAGPIGASVQTGLVTNGAPVVLGPNLLGVSNAIVTAGGVARGTVAGVYADTGIFFSTNPVTAFNSYGAAPTGGSSPMANNSGDTVGEWFAANVPATNVLGVMTLWDSWQLRAFGRKDIAPIIDTADGRGNAAWGLASAVAGPQSGYAWSFNYNTFVAQGGGLTAIAKAIEIGPWQRIQYPGSQISFDQAGSLSTVLGYAGLDAGSIGFALSPANPLATNVNAVRFAIGQLELGRPEMSAIKIRILSPPSTQCYSMFSDAFGGDAGGTSSGKDHIWRYFDPTVVAVQPCVLLQKVALDPHIPPGGTTSFKIAFANLGTVPLPNIVLTDVLPAGLVYLSALPAPTSVSSGTLTWNVGTVQPNQIVTLTVYVQATGVGSLLNTVYATSNGEPLSKADESVNVGLSSLLREEKTVSPSTAIPGQTVTYTITVYNEGTGPNGVPLVVTDYLPAGFSYAGLVSATVNGAAVTPTVNAANPNQPSFTLGQGIAADKTAVIRFLATISTNTVVGTYYNSAKLAFEGKEVGPHPEAPVTVAGGQIGSTIYRDWNGDGTQQATEEGMPGVTVNLYLDVNNNGTNDPGDVLLGTRITDANGQYLFTGLVPTNYVVAVPAAGSGGVPASYALTGDPVGPLNGVGNVSLTNNQAFLTMNFGYQPAGSGSLGDQVFEDLNKDGTWGAGEPGIANVTVWLYEDANGNGMVDATDTRIGTNVTSTAGLYAFTGLATNLGYLVQVDVSDPDLASYFAANPYVNTTGTTLRTTNLTGVVTNLDFGFYRNLPSSIGDQVFVDVNRDGVYTAGVDAPILQATVNLYLDGVLVATTNSDYSGQYKFANLPPGNYTVVVDTSDPNLPAGTSPAISSYSFSLPGNTDLTDKDFPFYQIISKSGAPTTARPGTNLTYSIFPYYPGPDDLVNATVLDPIPANTAYVAGSANAEGTNNNGVITWSFGSSQPHQAGLTLDYGYALCPGSTFSNNPVADTYIFQDAPTFNYGATDPLRTAILTNKLKVGFMRFDLSGLPSGAIIQSAIFYLQSTANNTKRSVQIRRALTPWVEGSGTGSATGNGASWNKRDGTNNWAAGAFGSGDYSSISYGTILFNGKRVALDITGLVNDWLATTNHGMVLYPAGTDSNDATWNSRTAGTASARPALVIRYLLASQSLCRSSSQTNIDLADTLLDSASPTTVNGAVNRLRTDRDRERLSLVRFDLGGIPPGAVITNAFLDFQVQTAQSSHTDTVYRVTTSWTEAGATWNLRDGVTRWANGTNFSTADYSPAAIGTLVPSATATYSVNVTALVSNWVNGLYPNYGVVLRSTGTDLGEVAYYSKEDGTASRWPVLRVSWGAVPSTSPATTVELHSTPRLFAGTNNSVLLTMTVSCGTNINAVTPPADLGVSASGVTFGKVSGPSPAGPVNLSSNFPLTFSWVYAVTNGSGLGEILFTGRPTSPEASFASGASESILVSPPLSFQVTVTNAGAGAITNVAQLLDDGGVEFNTPEVITATAASLGDRVWADANGNGLQDAGEVSVANVSVVLYNSSGVALATNVTDDFGLYRFYGLPAGTYSVGYLASTTPAGYLPTTPVLLSNIVVVSGQQYNDADFGLQPAGGPTAGSIGDLVWYDANQNGVLDGSEYGLSNVVLHLYADMNSNNIVDAGDILVATNTTAFDGTYTFGSLSPHAYVVQVQGSTLPAGMDLVSGGGTNGTPHDTFPVNLAPSQVYTNADFGYGWRGALGDYVWWDDNRNGLPDPGEAAVTNAYVMLYADANNNGILDPLNGDYQIGGTFTDPTGRYLFSNLPPGPYLVDVYEDSFNPIPSVRNTVATTADVQYWNLAPGQTYTNADFGYFVGARVEGNVFWDGNRNLLFESTETGLTNIQVVLSGTDMFGNPVTLTNTTDATGHFVFVVPEGNYSLTYNRSNVLSGYAPLQDATTPISYSFHAYPGEDWAPSFDFGVDNVGRVGDTIYADVDSNGSQGAGEPGLANVSVELYLDANNNNVLDAGDTWLDTQLTDATGRYLFVGLADGNYVVRVLTNTLPAGSLTTPTGKPATEWVSGAQAGATISGGNTVLDRDFGFPPIPNSYVTVNGTIWKDNDGNGSQNAESGITNVSVTIHVDTDTNGVPDFTYTVGTDSNGLYTVSGIPSNSIITVSIQTNSLPNAAYLQTYDPDGTLNSTTTFAAIQAVNTRNFGYQEQLGSLSGTVVEGNGNGVYEPGLDTPVPGAIVTLRYAGPDGILGTSDDVLFPPVTTGPGGQYSFTSLLPGLYSITKSNPPGFSSLADRDGGNPDVITVVLGPNDAATGRDFEVYRPGVLGDRVWNDLNGNGLQDPAEPGLSNVTVVLYSTNNLALATNLTDASGLYVFTNLLPGNYVIGVTPPAAYSFTAPNAGTNPAIDSDLLPTGYSASIQLASGQTNLTLDAGLLIPQPALALIKSITAGSTYSAPGDIVSYRLLATNSGNVTLTNVLITDPLLGSLACTQPVSLAPGQTLACTGSYAVRQADVDAGAVTNTAAVSGSPPAGAPLTAQASKTAYALQTGALRLFKTITSGATYTNVGDLVYYQLLATNGGNVTLTNVLISDPKLGSLVCTQPVALAPGQTLLCSGSYTITTNDLLVGNVINTATVTGQTPNGITLSNSASVTAITPQSGALGLSKTITSGATYTNVGDVVQYQLVATNSGNVILTNVLIVDAKLGSLACTQPVTLAPGQTLTCTGSYAVQQGDLNAGSVLNTATVTGQTPSGTTVSNAASATATARQLGALGLSKTIISGATYTNVGDVVQYQLVATNSGNVILTNVLIVDAKLGSLACTQPVTLAPGQTLTCTGSYAVQQGDLNAGSVLNTATVTGQTPSGTTVSNAASATATARQSGALGLSKTITSGATYTNVGDVVQYQLVATNSGNVILTNVLIVDAKLGSLACTQPVTLAPGQTLTCTGSYAVQQGDLNAGSVLNTATVTGQTPSGTTVSNAASATATARQLGALGLSKTIISGATYTNVGDVVQYQLVATNSGNVILTNVLIVDAKLGSLACTQPVTLAPGQTLTCTGSYAVQQGDLNAGSVLNTATVTGQTPSGTTVSNAASATATARQSGALGLSKTITSGATYTNVGDVVQYQLVATNSGNVILTNVLIVDAKLGSLACTQPVTLAPGQTLTCTGSYAVQQGDLNAGSVLNTATVTGQTPSGITVSNAASATATARQLGAIGLRKTITAGALFTLPGQTIQYQLVATNSGNVTLTNVLVVDAKLGSLACTQPITLAPGQTLVCSGTYTVTTNDLSAGAVTNTASVSAQPPGGPPVQAQASVVAYYQVATVIGHLYYDSNGDGAQQAGEPNLTNVTVLVTSGTNVFRVTSGTNGDWTASVPPGSVTVDVDGADTNFLAQVPVGYLQTEGTDPTTVNAPAGQTTSAGNDGYYWSPPTLACALNKVIECGLPWSFDGPTFTNGTCGTATLGVLSTATNAMGASGNTFTATRTWVVVDACGYSNTCFQVVTVIDTTAPVITACPTNISVSTAGGSCGSNVVFTVTATDTCPGQSVACIPASGSAFAKGVTTVVCTATDASGNTNACAFVVTVIDAEAPVASCPANIVVSTSPGACTSNVTFSAASTDNCPGQTVLCVPASGSSFAKGVTTVSCTATDASGNTNTCTFTVSVRDQEAPTVVCPGNILVATSSGACASNVTFTVSSADNCPGQAVACVPASGSSFGKGVTAVVCSSVDASGNSNACSFTVTVEDMEAPVVVCPTNLVATMPPGQCGASVSFSATVTDNCPGAGVECLPPASRIFGRGVTTVSCTGTDAVGNTRQCSFTVTVVDVEAPVVTCPASISVPTSPGACGRVVTFAASATDNCSGATVTCVPASSSVFVKGVTAVTCTAVDRSGNTAACQFQVTVYDAEAPSVVCPTNLTVSATLGACSALVTFAPVVTDNCAGAVVACAPPSGSFFVVGSTPVVCTAQDSSYNTAGCQFTVTVADRQSPVVVCSTNVTVSTPVGACVATNVNLGQAAATDNCGVVLLASNAPSVFLPGSTPVVWTAVDSAGNTAVCTQLVTVLDLQPPVIIGYPTNLQVNCGGTVPPPGTNGFMVTDACSNPVAVLFEGQTVLSSNGPSQYVLDRTYRVTDSASNSVVVHQYVTVSDQVAPVVICPGPAVVTAGQSLDPSVNPRLGVPTVVDECGGTVRVTYSDVAGQGYCPQVLSRTWTVEDEAGNVQTCVQRLTVFCAVLMTDSMRYSLANDSFNLLFSPDGGCYKLNSSTPGQFYYNAFQQGAPGQLVTFTIDLPYPWITQGAQPIHLYDGVTYQTYSGGVVRLVPGRELAAHSTQVTLGHYRTQSFGARHVIQVTGQVPATGFLLLTLHLDYGLEGSTGYGRGPGTPSDAVQCGTSTVRIPRVQSYDFGLGGPSGGTATIRSYNVFNKKNATQAVGAQGAGPKDGAAGEEPPLKIE